MSNAATARELALNTRSLKANPYANGGALNTRSMKANPYANETDMLNASQDGMDTMLKAIQDGSYTYKQYTTARTHREYG